MIRFTLVLISMVLCISSSYANEFKDPVREAGGPVNKKTIVEFIFPSGKHVKKSLEELSKQFSSEDLVVLSHPAYKHTSKSYRGFRLVKLLKGLDSDTAYDSKKFWIQVSCQDGWKAPPYDSDFLIRGKALLAYEEEPSSLKEPISKDGLWSLAVDKGKQYYPGPYYLVWNDSRGKNLDIMPLQVVTISVLLVDPHGDT